MAHVHGSGLQQHSIGDMYPLVSAPYEYEGKRLWALLDTRTGFQITGIPTRESLDCLANLNKLKAWSIKADMSFDYWLKEEAQ